VPDSLFDPEKRRSEVLAEICALGDFRPGSISATIPAMLAQQVPTGRPETMVLTCG